MISVEMKRAELRKWSEGETFFRRAWYELLRRPVALTAILAFQVRYSGRENIPSKGGVLVVSNHQSHLDPPLIGLGCPRQMNYLARRSLFAFAPFRWLIASLGAIPIDLEGSGIDGLKESLRRLRRGEMLLVFPEGTRTYDGRIAPFRPGFTTLAVRSQAAILPAAIDGAFAAWPRRRRFPRPGRIAVHYGKPIFPHEFAAYNQRELLAEVERRVRECSAHLAAYRKRLS